MKEIEAKILEINRQEIEAKLKELGAEKIFDGQVDTIFYDAPDRSIRDNDKTFRLRKIGDDKIVITFKSPLDQSSGVKIKQEDEVEVSDFEVTERIIDSLGFKPWIKMGKHRTSYQLDNVHIEIDKHNDQFSSIPEFMEIEALDEETVYKYAKMFGFSKKDCKAWTILDLADHYKVDY